MVCSQTLSPLHCKILDYMNYDSLTANLAFRHVHCLVVTHRPSRTVQQADAAAAHSAAPTAAQAAQVVHSEHPPLLRPRTRCRRAGGGKVRVDLFTCKDLE